MSKEKKREPVPKLENLGKIAAATFFVPLFSSLAIYGYNVGFGATETTKNEASQTKPGYTRAETASKFETTKK